MRLRQRRAILKLGERDHQRDIDIAALARSERWQERAVCREQRRVGEQTPRPSRMPLTEVDWISIMIGAISPDISTSASIEKKARIAPPKPRRVSRSNSIAR